MLGLFRRFALSRDLARSGSLSSAPAPPSRRYYSTFERTTDFGLREQLHGPMVITNVSLHQQINIFMAPDIPGALAYWTKRDAAVRRALHLPTLVPDCSVDDIALHLASTIAHMMVNFDLYLYLR